MSGPTDSTSTPPPPRKRSRGNTGLVRNGVPAQRKRNAVACSVCRARKTKCDNKKPRCSYCCSIGELCDTEEPLSVRQRLSKDSQAILDRIDLFEQRLLQSTTVKDFPSLAANHVTVSPGPSSTPAPPLDVAIPGASLSIGCKAYPSVETVLDWPVFKEQYKSCLNLRDLLLRGPETADKPISQNGRASNLPIGLEIESCARYLDDFFLRIHIKNPVLDEKEIRQWARDIAFNGFGWDAQSCLIVSQPVPFMTGHRELETQYSVSTNKRIIICALGAISMPFSVNEAEHSQRLPDLENQALAKAWFEASQKRIGMLIGKGGGVLEAQCFFFSGVYMMHSLRPFAAWSFFIQALASCQTFQCFGDIRAHVEFDTTEIENGKGWHAEESMYWTCFKTELETRCQLNPPGFNFSDLSYPEFLPSPPAESLRNQDQAWFFYLAEIALRQLANKVLTHILPYSSGQKPFNLSNLASLTTDFEIQVHKWSQLLPPESDVHHEPYDRNVLSFILNAQLMNCYETIYWPYLAMAINFPAQRNLTFDVFVQRGLQASVNKIYNRGSASHHRHHGTWLAMRSCTISALVLVAAKRSGELEHLIPGDWKVAVQRAIQFLDYWSQECGDSGNRRDILEDALRNIR